MILCADLACTGYLPGSGPEKLSLENMTFEEDLTKRRIDVAAFAAGDPEKYASWARMYAQMHPNSFYVALKMVINDVRRRFWLAEAVKPAAATAGAAVAAAPAKPAMRRATIPPASPAAADR